MNERLFNKLMEYIWDSVGDHYAGNEREMYDFFLGEHCEINDEPEVVEWIKKNKGYAATMDKSYPGEFAE